MSQALPALTIALPADEAPSENLRLPHVATTAQPLRTLDDLHPQHRRGAMGRVTWAWICGAIWSTTIGGAPLTLFAHGLGATEWHFGLLVAMPFIATLLSLPAALWIDLTGARKRIFLTAQLTQRMSWVAIATLPTVLLLQGRSSLALVSFLCLMALHHASGCIGGPAWTSWMADLVPDRVRGRYFARRRQWGIVSSVPAAWLAGVVLDVFARGDSSGRLAVVWAAILFAVTSFAGMADIVLHIRIPDTAPQHLRKPRGGPILSPLLRPLKDRNFVWFCMYVAVLTMAVAPMGQFANLYLVEKLGIGAAQVQLMMLVAPLLGQFLIVPIWGRMADRFGRKPMMAISTFGLAPVGLGWCVMNMGYGWLGYVLSISGAMLWAAVEIANFNLVLAMSGSADEEGNGGGSGYTSVNSVISAIAGVIGGVGAGWIMASCRHVEFTLGMNVPRPFGAYEILFAASAALRLIAGVVFLPRLHEPTAKPTGEAMVFVASNLYSNLVGIATAPARKIVRVVKRRRVEPILRIVPASTIERRRAA